MKRILFSCFFVFAFPHIFTAQQNKIDSLKKEIKNNRSFYKNYSELAWEYLNLNSDSATIYVKKIEKLKLNERQSGEFKNLQCAYYLLMQDFDKSIRYGLEAEKIALKYNDYKTLGSTYNSISTSYRFKGNFKDAEKYVFKSLKYRIKRGDHKEIVNSYKNIAAYYTTINDSENAIKYFKLVLEKEKDEKNKLPTYSNLGYLYSVINKSELGLKYFKSGEELLKKYGFNNSFTAGLYLNWSNSLVKLYRYDEALEKIKIGMKYKPELTEEAGFYVNLSEIYFNKKMYAQARDYASKALKIDKETDYLNGTGTDYMLIGKSLYGEKRFDEAKKNLTLAEEILNKTKDSVNLIEVYEFQLKNTLSKNNDLESIQKLENYFTILENISKNEAIKNLNDIETKYRTAEKDSKLKTQQLELEKEKSNRNLAIGGIGFLILLFAGGFLWNRNRQKRKEAEQKNTVLELQNNLQAMELSNLNKQLDPHEFKNLLLSLAPEIQEKSPATYRKMAKLANLLKSSLSNSSITENLETQLEQIEIYLNLEKSTVDFPLNYQIENRTHIKGIQIPRLLLKNLVENSIKHGIKPKRKEGNIDIIIYEEENNIRITVDDNGTGRKESINRDTGIGTSTYINLFKLLNEKNKNKAQFEMIDKQEGTTVSISIPLQYNYQLNNSIVSKN